jgi:hypothetical protein
MASGPYGTSGGWDELLAELNTQFGTPANLTKFSNKFKEKHGDNGMGDGADKKPYKFGHFADKHEGLSSLDTPAKRGRFLIDAGERRWEPISLGLLEHTIRHSLTNATLKKIRFEPGIATLPIASAEIKNQNGDVLTSTQQIEAASSTSYTITIKCPPAIWP